MKVLTVKPHWAWLIFHGKDTENRSQRTNHRGPLLIQASKTPPSKREYAECAAYARERGIELPPLAELKHGGIVGICEVTSCSPKPESVWFMGPWGWRLENRIPLPFVPIAGRLGIFDAPQDIVTRLLAASRSREEARRIQLIFGLTGLPKFTLNRIMPLPSKHIIVTTPGGDDQLRLRYVNGE